MEYRMMIRPSHDQYGAIFGECECARCHPRPESDEPDDDQEGNQ